MGILKAFVGHSFTSDDAPIIRTFLDYFDTIKNMGIGFSWEHANAAEPIELAEKVLKLMDNKNLFIGICTKKEVAINRNELSRPWFKKDILYARENLFSLKTSDWIIQEVGLAVGKGLKLILLVESGVRTPGGLQGNLEYIPFDRTTPEKSFGKILEMIQSLIPKAKVLAPQEEEVRAAPTESPKPPEKNDEEWLKPKPEWDYNDFSFGLFHMVAIDDKNGEKVISEAFLATKEGQKPQSQESWEAYREYLRLTFGRGGSLLRLEELAKNHPANSDVQKYLAKGYLHYDQHEKAAGHFELAAQRAESPEQELSRYEEAALAFAQGAKEKEATRIIDKMKTISSNQANREVTVVRTLLGIARIESNEALQMGLSEKLLDLRPDEMGVRFSLAYKYFERDEQELALFHYLKIPYQEREGGVWNNLGVQFGSFDLKSKSVEAFRKSESMGGTLAMSNLANRLIKEGFLEEAKEICRRALQIKDYHKNIGHTISSIEEIPEKEIKKEEEIIVIAKPLSKFYRDYGHASTKTSPILPLSNWQGPDCALKVTISGTIFLAEGTFERKSSVSLAIAKSILGEAKESSAKYLVRYEGTITGRSIKAIFTKTKEGDSPVTISLHGFGLNENVMEVLLILSDSLREIGGYNKSAPADKKFFSFSRLD